MTASARGISSMATRHVLVDLAADYERSGSHAVAIESVAGIEAARRVREGEPFDFVVLADDALDALEVHGAIVRGSRDGIASSGIAVAVKAGTPRRALDTEASLRDAVLGAARVGYSTGPSGAHVLRLFDRWGLEAARRVQAPPGVPVAALIARGEVDIGFQQLSELIHEPGIDVVGPLPPEVQRMTLFSGALCSAGPHREAARKFLAFAASARADAAKIRHGMQGA
jgi:molybdate transport system substrate-binding protein